MIHVFRKEIRKWYAILWVILAAMVLSSFALLVKIGTSSDDIGVATVNGKKISLKAYRSSLSTIEERIGSLREYARMLGVSENVLMASLFGSSNPYEMALDNCVKEQLLDQVRQPFNIKLAGDYFKEEFVRTLPQGIVDERGSVNMDSYQGYLQRYGLSPAEYEKRKEKEFKRLLLDRFVVNSFYVPQYVTREKYMADHQKKSFNIVMFPLEKFINDAKKGAVDAKELQSFFDRHKERYRIKEKRKASYWQVSPEDYAKNVEISEEAIESFYAKNKTSKFRVPPEVKVRHILLKFPEKSAKQSADDVFKKAQELYEKIKANPAQFGDLAKVNSHDKTTAKDGGVTSFFKRGVYDPDFENAAFRLQNKGELSGIVKTAEGYEIIQLVDRINASEKPLDEVRDEITKLLKAKKAVTSLKSDLEIMLHALKTDENALIAFTQTHRLPKKDSGWLTQEVEQGQGVTSNLAQRLFSKHKGQSRHGYFFDKGVYTIYQRTGEEKSSIPALETIKDQVLAYYYKTRAKSRLKELLKEGKAALLSKKTSLKDLAAKNGVRYIETAMISNKDEIKDIPQSVSLVAKMFVLNNQMQILQDKHEAVYYLAQLREAQPFDEQKFLAEQSKIINQEKNKGSNVQMITFIASLQRNAKIDVDKNIIKAYQGR